MKTEINKKPIIRAPTKFSSYLSRMDSRNNKSELQPQRSSDISVVKSNDKISKQTGAKMITSTAARVIATTKKNGKFIPFFNVPPPPVKEFKIIPYEGAKDWPIKRGSKYSAGIDLSSPEFFILEPGHHKFVYTQKTVIIPSGYYVKIEPRSSLAGMGVITLGGIIDSDYTGQIRVMLHNCGYESVAIDSGQFFCQLILMKHETDMFQIKSDIVRNDNGFGSSDRQEHRVNKDEVMNEMEFINFVKNE